MRCGERSWLIPALKEVVAKLPRAEVEERCERANVSWAPVGKPIDLFTDAHLLATGGLIDVFISQLGGGEGGKFGMPALPVQFGGAQRPGLTRQPPRMGEHSREVLGEAGFSEKEIAALANTKVIVAA
jgi:crotonobetainyl-CoA:carnitine CoA-transferase CaiB-like acyl-CoA transferase